MTRILGLTAAVLFAGAAFAADEKKEAPKFDATKMVGTWDVTAGMKDGKKSEADNLKGVTFDITKDTMKLKTPMGAFEFKYTLDEKTSPVTINLELVEPEAFKSKATGIVKIDGETLMLCYPPMGGDKPKDFDAKEKSGHYSFTMKKAAKKEEKKDK